MKDFPDHECRACYGMMVAFHNSRDKVNPKTKHICVGYEKTYPGIISYAKLMEIESQRWKTFDGKLISVGVTQYCGRMVALGKLPITSTGFKAYFTYNNETATANKPTTSSPSRMQTLQAQRTEQSNQTSSAAAGSISATAAVPSDPLDVLKDVKVKLASMFSPLWGSCGALAGKGLESLQNKFLSRLWENTKVFGGSVRDTGRRVGEGSAMLVRSSVANLHKKLNNDDDHGSSSSSGGGGSGSAGGSGGGR